MNRNANCTGLLRKEKMSSPPQEPAIPANATSSPELAGRMAVSAQLAEALNEVLDAVMLLLEADLGNIQLFDPARGVLQIVAHRGYSRRFLDTLTIVPIDAPTASARSLRTGQRVIIPDVFQEPTYAPFVATASQEGYRALQATPFFTRDGQYLGALSTQTRKPRDFSSHEIRILDLYSRQAGDAIVRARVERDLAVAQRRLESALSAGAIGIFDWNRSTDMVHGDVNFQRLFGIPFDKDGNAALAEFERAIHPDDRKARSQCIKHTLDSGEPYEAEYRIVNGSKTRWVISRGRIEKDESGQATHFMGVLLDITSRRQAEQQWQDVSDDLERLSRVHETILSTMDDFATVVDRDGRFLYANRRLLAVWNKTLDEIVGKTRIELGYEQAHHDKHLHEIAQILDTRQAIRGETAFAGASGVSGIYDYIFTPVLGPNGTVESIIRISRNVTERKRTEEALQIGRAHV